MAPTKSLAKTAVGFLCGLLSFLLFVPTGYWTWVGVFCALLAVFLGFSHKRDTKTQEYVSFAGVLLALVAALLFLAKSLL